MQLQTTIETAAASALDQAPLNAQSSITSAIQFSPAESSRLLSLVEHKTIKPIISVATGLTIPPPSTITSIISVATEPSSSPPPGRWEKILNEKNQLILELADDRDGWKSTAEESFKRGDSWAERAEKWQDAARKRGEKLKTLEREGDVWCKKIIELEREVIKLRAKAMEDSERIKELSREILDAEGEEDGWREKAEKVKREAEDVKKKGRKWKKSSQDAEVTLKTLDELGMNLMKREDELAKEGVKLKKRQDELAKKVKDSQDEVKALKDEAEVKVQAESKKQNTIEGIKKDIIKALDRNDITSAKQSLGKM